MTYVQFIVASLVVLLTPGPTNTLLASMGAAVGVRRAIRLPFAEATGYTVAISLYYAAGTLLQDAVTMLQALAAIWLLYAATSLWRLPVLPTQRMQEDAFRRVLITTVLNPKAMLMAIVIIPRMMPDQFTVGAASFVCLSMLAGYGWMTLGAMLPNAIRPYSYKAASVVIFGFAMSAAISSMG